MQLPFVGPLAYIPMQAAAAYLLDLLLRKQPLSGTSAGPTQVLSSERGTFWQSLIGCLHYTASSSGLSCAGFPRICGVGSPHKASGYAAAAVPGRAVRRAIPVSSSTASGGSIPPAAICAAIPWLMSILLESVTQDLYRHNLLVFTGQ